MCLSLNSVLDALELLFTEEILPIKAVDSVKRLDFSNKVNL